MRTGVKRYCYEKKKSLSILNYRTGFNGFGVISRYWIKKRVIRFKKSRKLTVGSVSP